jgi:hypothetical protein
VPRLGQHLPYSRDLLLVVGVQLVELNAVDLALGEVFDQLTHLGIDARQVLLTFAP